MKKIMAVALLVLMVVSMIPIAFASERVAEVDAQIASEVRVMDNVEGAHMRLLQLENAINRSIDQGLAVLPQVTDREAYAELEAILEEMVLLHAEVQAVDPTSETVVETFVSLRFDAQELVTRFRKVAHSVFNESKRAEIRADIEARNNAMYERRNEMIQAKTCEVRAKRVSLYLDSMGVTNDALVRSVASCAISDEALRIELQNTYGSFDRETRARVSAEITTEAARARVKNLARAQVAINSAFDTQTNRFEARIKHIPSVETRERLQMYFDKRVIEFESRIQERMDVRKEVTSDIRANGTLQARLPVVNQRPDTQNDADKNMSDVSKEDRYDSDTRSESNVSVRTSVEVAIR